jgi:hypothetical protein
MSYSILLAPDTPEWLMVTVVVVSFIFIIGLWGWGMVLERRYTGPYTLIKTSNREKWRRAAILAPFQTAMLPLMGLAAPFISPLPDQWPFIPICSGVWIVLLPIVTVFKRWEFERQIQNNQRLNKMMKDKNGVSHPLFSGPFAGWIRIFFTAEQKRFFNEGFPEDTNPEEKDTSASNRPGCSA